MSFIEFRYVNFKPFLSLMLTLKNRRNQHAKEPHQHPVKIVYLYDARLLESQCDSRCLRRSLRALTWLQPYAS